MRKLKINIENVSKKFGKKNVLNKLNLQIFESESLAIIGESGSGKSVLTKCIDGLLDYDSGSISFNEITNIKKLSFLNKNKYMAKFGILFQNAALFDSLNIRENLMFASSQNNDIIEVLEDVSLPKSILQEFPSNLSIGVQKRIGLARAILQKPEILILDEPTTGLDPIIAKQINYLIKNLVKKKKITTITVTHDMQSVFEFSDYTAFIENGQISWYGKSKDIRKKSHLSLTNFINGIS